MGETALIQGKPRQGKPAQGKPAQSKLVQGNQACALGAIAAGCRFYAGYPITPSSEIAEELARALPSRGGVFVQMEDEIAALAAVIGASVAGAKAMTATSGPGFSLMQEHIGYAAMIEAPCVIVNVMRGGPSTGLPTSPSQADVMQARWGTHGDHPIIALAPASAAEVYHLTVRAFNLAERFRTPVVLLYDELIGHLRQSVTLSERVTVVDRTRPSGQPANYRPFAAGGGDVPPLAAFGDGYRFHLTGLAHDDQGYPTEDPATVAAQLERRHRKIDNHLDEIVTVERVGLDDAEVVVVAYGITAGAAQEAVLRARDQGIRAGLLRLITLWPFPDAQLAELAQSASLRILLVAELNLGQVAGEVARAVAGRATVVSHGRVDGRPITPAQLLDRITTLAAPPGARP